MTEKQYLLVCEQAMRNIFNAQENLHLYAEPSLGDYQHFAEQVGKAVDGYRDALENHLSAVREADAVADQEDLQPVGDVSAVAVE